MWKKINSGDSPASVDLAFRLSAQSFLLVSIVATTWCIAGYYPVGRLIASSGIMAAVILIWLQPTSGNRLCRSSPGNLLNLVLIAIVAIGIIQIVPVNFSVPWSGVDQLRREFGPSDSVTRYPLTLSPWQSKTWLAMAAIGLSGFCAAKVLFNSSRSRIWLLGTIAACGAGQVFWAIVQTLRFPNFIFWGIENPGGSRPFGTFLNRNHGADFAAMSLACAVGLLWYLLSRPQSHPFTYRETGLIQRIASRPSVVFLWLCVIWLLSGIGISLSRGGWASTIVALCVLPFLRTRITGSGRSVFIPIAIISLLAVGAGIQLVGLEDKVERRIDDLDVERVLTDARMSHWKDAAPAIRHFLPFGSGFGTYGYAYLPFNPKPNNGWYAFAHNQYLETLMEAGLPGLLLILFGMAVAVRICLRLCSGENEASTQAIGVAGIMVLIIQGLHAVTDFGIMMPANLLTASVIIGSAVAASEQPERLGSAWPQVTGLQNAGSYLTGTLVTLVLAAAIWHHMACLRVDKLLSATEFTLETPVLSAESATAHIERLEHELRQSPDNEFILQRLTQLYIYRAQRVSYDQVRSRDAVAGRVTDPLARWNLTTLEAVIERLFDESETAASAEQKSTIRKVMREEPDLIQARETAIRTLQLNPVQPRTHQRLAILDAASGQPWEQSFRHAVQLSGADSGQSFRNGLFAWAVHDRESMLQQWKQTLETDPSMASAILQFSRQTLSGEDIVNELMPENWLVPFRMAQSLNQNSEDVRELRTQLLIKADEAAARTLSDDSMTEHRARGYIAMEVGNFAVAAEHFAQAVKASPRDHDLRYLQAVAEFRGKRFPEAISAARIATQLAPGNVRNQSLLESAMERLRQQDGIRSSGPGNRK